MFITLFASEASAESASGIGALGVSLESFIIQLIAFVLVFILLKRFAFKPIVKILEKRRQTIEDGVKLGLEMEKEREKAEKKIEKITRDARHEADQIVSDAHKEAREIIREAEKTAQRKTNAMLADAEARIHEESEQARRKLEKDIVGLVSEATEAVVGEKVDAKKDAEIIEKAVKGRNK